MIRHPKRAAAIAAIVGVVTGGSLAAALPSAVGTPTNAPWRVSSMPFRIDLAARPAPADSELSFEARGPARLAVRQRDPAGGPDWAVRTFVARTRLPYGLWRTGRPRYASRPAQRCAQLVRVVNGRAGWIDGQNTFRVARLSSMTDSPNVCVDHRRQRHFSFSRAQVRTFAALDLASATDPVLLGNVMWGLAGDDASLLSLTISGKRRRQQLGPRGAFLRFSGPNRDLGTASAKVRWRDGRAATLTDPFVVAGSSAQRRPEGAARNPVISGTERILARTYDPGGGASWGLRSVRTRDGHWCSGVVGQIVGRQVGTVDTELGTFTTRALTTPRGGCAAENGRGFGPSAERPVAWEPLGWGGGMALGQTDPPFDALRRQSGRMTFAGHAMEGVTSVTIRTATTVRTVEPTGPTRAFIVSYDTSNGGLMLAFNTAHLTAHFADGRSKTISAMGPGL